MKLQLLGFLLPLACLLPFNASPTPASVFGAPTICFPMELGKVRTITYSSGTLVGKHLDASRHAREVIAVLDSTPRTLVHIEALRLSAMLVMRTRNQDEAAHALVSGLRWRLVEGLSAATPLEPEHLGRLWFDLAYAQSALHQGVRFGEQGRTAAMTEAMRLLPKDGAAQLGCALGMFDSDQNAGLGFNQRMLAALEVGEGGDPYLVQNLEAIGDQFVGESSAEAIARKLKRELGKN